MACTTAGACPTWSMDEAFVLVALLAAALFAVAFVAAFGAVVVAVVLADDESAWETNIDTTHEQRIYRVVS